MEWSRVKSILICVFLVVNIVLANVYIDGNSSQIIVDDATVTNTISVLNSKNIFINKDVIVKKTSDVAVFNITNTANTTKDFAQKLYDEGKKHSISYFNPESTNVQNETVVYKGKSEAYKDIHKNLKKLNTFDNYNYKKSVIKNGETTTVIYNVYNNGLCIYDTYLKVVTDVDGVTLTLNNWLGDIYSETGYASVQTAPEALISFSNAVIFDSPITITSIDKGYIAGNRDGELRTTNAIPVWKIECDNGNSYFIDMRNGDLLNI